MSDRATLRSCIVQLRIGGGADVHIVWTLADGDTAGGTVKCANSEELAQLLENIGAEPF